MCECGDLHPSWVRCAVAAWRDTPLYEDPREVEEQRRERDRSTHDFEAPFKEAA